MFVAGSGHPPCDEGSAMSIRQTFGAAKVHAAAWFSSLALVMIGLAPSP